MLTLFNRPVAGCDRVSRRGALRIGSLGLGGLSLSGVLAAQTAAAESAGLRGRARAVILFWMAGGPSQLETYDPKPEAPAQVRGPFGSIATSLPGLSVCDMLPRHAVLGDRLAVIRSLHHHHSVHDDASHWVQTGYPLLMAREQGQKQPSQGSAVAALRGANRVGAPPYVCIPEAYSSQRGFYQRAATLSARFDPLDAGGDPSLGNFRPPEFALPGSMTVERLQNRRVLLARLDTLRRAVDETASLQAMDDVQRQAFDLVAGTRARAAFDLSREPDAVRERYGRHDYGQAALLARRLVESGVTFVTINLFEKDVDWWDDHYTIEKNMRQRLPKFDQAIGTLLEDLRERGLDGEVLTAAFGEFGRAPRIDQHAGRGHWPRAFSALLSGGGVREGQVIGSTTADAGEPLARALTPGDLLASIYTLLGIDPHQTLPDRLGRPVSLLPSGEPIAELL